MTTSYTRSMSETYSLASAKYVASKIATDLRQVQRYYPKHGPSDADIMDYALEAALLSHRGYVNKITYGFQRHGDWILALDYTNVDGTLVADDRAGGIYRYANTDGTIFNSFLRYSLKWSLAPSTDRDEFAGLLPFTRTTAPAPGYTGGYHTSDRTYSAHGTGFTRSMYRPL